MLRILLLLATCACLAHAALPLPKYVKPCARSDPRFNECAKKHAQAVLAHPGLENGDPKYRIPPYNPLEVTEVKVSTGKSLGFSVRSAKIYGIPTAQVEGIDIDFDKQHIHVDLWLPKFSIIGKYDVEGRLLVLPITGNGDFNCTLVSPNVTFDADYSLKTINGNKHVVLKSAAAAVDPQRVYTKLTNLFNGDKLLGKQMNAFLDENWLEVHKEMSPPILDAVIQTIVTIFNRIAALVPYDVAFPEKL